MSLRRQIILAGALLFGLALLGVAIGQWLSGREFVREQMAAHAQETATTLALSLSTALRDGDPALVKTTVLPAFDRGYYRRIAVRDLADRIVVAEEAAAGESRVPRWFAALAQLDPPHAEALVSAGWKQAGRVEVEGDTEFALRQLWHGSLRALTWLSLVYGLSLALMLAWLRRLLAPMAAVERIAGAAAGRHIGLIAVKTRVRELASFIAGFNRLAGLVNAHIAEEEARAERFRAAALADPLTGLPNRLGLEAAQADAPAAAWLGLIEARGVDEINRARGYAAGDAFVVAMADCVRRAFPQALTARLHAATFAVALADGGEGDEAGLLQSSGQLLDAMNRTAAGHGVAPLDGAAGWTATDAGASLSATLAAADLALASAHAEGRRRVWLCREAPTSESGLGARALMRWIDEAIATGNYALSSQTVFSVPASTPLQTEVYLRLHGPDGLILPAQTFLPLVQRERDLAFLDRAMFERLRQAIDHGRMPPGAVAANISAGSFRAGCLPPWMAAALERWPASHPLILELREADVVAAPDAAEGFATALQSFGAVIALDHFGTHSGGIGAMRRLLPRYVKLDASLSRGLEAVDRRFQVEALVRAARSLDIPVWAQVFDSPGALDILAEMGVVGAQGYTLAQERTLGA